MLRGRAREDRGRPSAPGAREELGAGVPRGRGGLRQQCRYCRSLAPYTLLLPPHFASAPEFPAASRPQATPGLFYLRRGPACVPCSHTLPGAPSSRALTPECPAQLSCSAAPPSPGTRVELCTARFLRSRPGLHQAWAPRLPACPRPQDLRPPPPACSHLLPAARALRLT